VSKYLSVSLFITGEDISTSIQKTTDEPSPSFPSNY